LLNNLSTNNDKKDQKMLHCHALQIANLLRLS